ncbi:hypothetical protein, variant [Verruconis gallopava]|nr:hypothetical protein, variant [Verruconis gallopava]KIW06570.1 hypothetical protein, variant [Verruconis gallopava]
MVGAGGIGCELLKNLVLTGFGEVHVVDLDTIDLSNLNRQFLFRHEHIKKSKALVAKESAGRFNPAVTIEAYHANIKDAQFNIDWYKQFDVVFNALDNADARRHVNRMCIAADVPLVDGGTTGFLGNVRFIKKGVTECYDCIPKEPPKSFPICTIRSTPSQPIHCIVWAKSYLFVEIFGISEDTSAELDETQDADNKDEIADLKKEQAELKHIRNSMGSEQFPRLVFDKVFKHDVERLRSVEGFWDKRRRPDPLDFDTLVSDSSKINGAECAKRDQSTWSLAENFAVFLDSLHRLSARMAALKAKGVGEEDMVLAFDKDDEDTLDFVAASSNLRSHIFGIETHPKFDIKQMAGNIIPAIATTNAIFAGLMVLHAFKIMRGPDHYKNAPMVFSQRSTDRVLTAEKDLARPNPECVVCGVARTTVIVDPERATMRHIVEDILKAEFGYAKEFTITSGGEQLYEAMPPVSDDEDDENDQEVVLQKKLTQLELLDGSAIIIHDEREESPNVDLEVRLSFKQLPADDKPVQTTEVPQIPKKPSRSVMPGETATNGINSALGKRKRSSDEGEGEGPNRKKGKMPTDKDSVILIDDDDSKPIELD